MYGCDQADSSAHRLKERIFPRLLAKNSDMFSFADCNFKVQKSKEGTGRVVVARDLGLLYSYTLEASFCGANFGRQCDCHFNSYDLEVRPTPWFSLLLWCKLLCRILTGGTALFLATANGPLLLRHDSGFLRS